MRVTIDITSTHSKKGKISRISGVLTVGRYGKCEFKWRRHKKTGIFKFFLNDQRVKSRHEPKFDITDFENRNLIEWMGTNALSLINISRGHPSER